MLSQFELLLPLAVTWATEQEQRILCDGVPLSEKEVDDARSVGVREPERIRLLRVETIPRPSQPELRAACDAIDFLTPADARTDFGLRNFYSLGLLGGPIARCARARHVAQYERLGAPLAFLRKYLFECLALGYAASPLELEAITVAAPVCGG